MSCTLQLNTENTFISVTVRALEAFRFKWVTAKKEKRLPLKSECLKKFFNSFHLDIYYFVWLLKIT